MVTLMCVQLIDENMRQPVGLVIPIFGLPAELERRVAPVFGVEEYAISTYQTDPERQETVERMYAKSLLGQTLRANSIERHRAVSAAGGAIATADGNPAVY